MGYAAIVEQRELTMELRRAVATDIAELMNWFDSVESCRQWGGPNFEFPYTEESFFRDIKWQQMDSYSLEQDPGELLGFGQIYAKLGRSHLARLVIHPANRAQGLGNMLVKMLLEKGSENGQQSSLYVLENNCAAISCYQRAGFKFAAQPKDDDVPPECLFMVRKP